MADFLNFKKGLAAGLETAAKKAGTIYVTTDERAMYVDISDSVRIRLGDFIVASSLEALSTEAYRPYSTTALYYIEKENALARYDGSKWVQINDTAALQNAITTLNQNVGSLQDAVYGSVGEDNVRAGGLVDKVSALETAVGEDDAENPTGLYEDIKNLQDQIDELAGGDTGDSLSSLSGRISALEETVGDATEGLVADVDDLQTRMAVEEAATENFETRIKAIEEADFGKQISDLETDLEGQINVVDGKADKNAQDITGLDGRLTTAEGTIATHTQTLTSHDGRITTAQTRADNAYALAETAKANAKTAQDEVDAVELKVEALESTVNSEVHGNAKLKTLIDGLDSELEQLTTTVGNNKTAAEASIKEAKDAAAAAQKTADDAAAQADTNKTDIAGLTTRVGNLETADGEQDALISANTQAAAAAQSAAEKAQGEVDALEGVVAGVKSTAEDAQTRVEQTEKDIADLEAIVVTGDNSNAKLRADIGTVSSNLATLTTTVGENKTAAEKGISEAKGAAQTAQNEVDALEGVVAGVKTTAEGAATQANTNKEAITTLQGTVSGHTTAIEKNAEDILALQGVIGHDTNDTDGAATGLYATMDSKISAAIAANDAMTFMGVVNSNSDLPATANKGDTYKVGTAGTYAGQTCLVGDLIINNGADGAAAQWVIVPSGGEDYNDPQLATDAATDTIALKNFAGNKTLGSVQFVGGEGVQIDTTSTTTDGVNAGVVTVSMVWGTF